MNDKAELDILVLTDADNTLWDTDSVFREAQMGLLKAVKSLIPGPKVSNQLAFLRSYDQAIAKQHHSGLKYPPDLLVRALILGLAGEKPSKAASKVVSNPSTVSFLNPTQIDTIVQDYFKSLDRVPTLRLGVLEGLNRLVECGIKTIVVTEGDKHKIEKFILHHKLQGIDQIISAKKSAQLYRRLKKLAGPNTKTVMIGDQLVSDIQFSQLAGVTAVHFAGGFNPSRYAGQSNITADYSVVSFSDAINAAINN